MEGEGITQYSEENSSVSVKEVMQAGKDMSQYVRNLQR
jgi:hypothetical protein